MSYEFNPESQVFEFPNPYKVENLGLLCAATVLLLSGAWAMISVRERLAHGLNGSVLVVLLISGVLLLLGIGLMAKVFTRLRFFFGRNRPNSLAPGVALDQDGDSQAANIYKETLRQNAITYQEPKGPLNGLLYSFLPNLIFAPMVIQRTAQAQFYNFVSLSATLLSFLLCWFLFGHGNANGWIGLVYAAFAVFQLFRPILELKNKVISGHPQTEKSAENAVASTEVAQVGSSGLLVLISLAILGPVLLAMIGSHLPDLAGFSINGVLLIALCCVLAGSGVFGLALKKQLQAAPQAVGSARVSETLTMNAHPNKLIEEIDRVLMERWFSRIPNRRYTHTSPKVEGAQGKFSAEIFEETQPRPQTARVATGLAHALATPQFFWLTCLTALATGFLIIGAIAVFLATQQILSGSSYMNALAFGLSQLAVGLFCFSSTHILWGRFDFVSELIWIDINGSFESAKVNLGNQISGQLQTTKNVINIESMTMRVWVSEIDTVIFGKDEARQMIGMRGLQGLADDLSASLKSFGESRSMVLAPGSHQDMERAQQIGAVSQLMQTGNTQHAAAVQAAVLAMNQSVQNPQTSEHLLNSSDTSGAQNLQNNTSQHCVHCGTVVVANASFCGKCGKAL